MASPFIQAGQALERNKLARQEDLRRQQELQLFQQQFQRQQEDRQRQQLLQGLAFQALSKQPQQGPVPMAPGQPSQPMAPPGPPPMGAAGGMSMMPQGAPPPGGPQGPPPGAAPQGPPPGGSPQAQPPAPPQGWKPSPAMGGQPGVTPGQGFDMSKAIAAIDKLPNVPDDVKMGALEQMLPIMNAQNKEALDQYKIKSQLEKDMLAFEKERRMQLEAELRDKRENRRTDLMERRVVAAENRAAKAGSASGAGGAEELTEGGKRVAAELVRMGRPLPGGYGKTGASRGNAILNAMALEEEGGAGSGAIAGDLADYRANSSALRNRQQFVSAGQQFVRNMKSQTDLVEKYMEKGALGSPPAFNKWIQAGRKAIAGDPDVSALDTAIRGLAREHQRIVTGVTSNAQLHVAAQQTADELMNVAQTPEQMRAVLKVMREEADNAIKAGQDEVKDLQQRIRAPRADAGGAPAAVPKDDMKAKVEAAGVKYEPDKYEYRVVDGKVQRREK